MTEEQESAVNLEQIKVVCPECGYSKMISAKVVPLAGIWAACPKCSHKIFIPPPATIRQQTIITHQSVSDTQVPSGEKVDNPPLSAMVKFQTFTVYDNRFKGKGTVLIEGETIQVIARRRRLFSLGKKTEQYPLCSIRNRTRKGKVVNFAIPVGNKQWQAMLVCEDEKVAEAIAARLPATADSSLYTMQQANQELKDQLAKLPKGMPVTWALLAMNIMAYGAIAFATKRWFQFDAAYLTAVGANFSPLTTSGQWWRILTATFLHLNFFHLLFNMIALYSFGRLAERLYGAKTFLGIYLLAGIAGSCGTLLFFSHAVGVGASGAIFGLMGVIAVFLAKDHDFLSPGARKQLFTNFAIYGAYSLMQGFGKAGIDNAAHVGGLFAGLVMAWSIGTPLRLRKETMTNWFSRRVAAATCLVLLCAGIAVVAAPKQGDEYKIHVALNELLTELGAKETVLAQEAQKLNARLSAQGNDANPAVDQEVAQELIRLWKDTYEGYAERVATQQPKSEGVKRRQEVLLAYARLKQQGGKLLAEAVEKDDQKFTEEGKQKIDEANKLAAELEKPVQWYR